MIRKKVKGIIATLMVFTMISSIVNTDVLAVGRKTYTEDKNNEFTDLKISEELKSNITAYLPFEEHANDSSGSIQTTAKGELKYVNGVEGKAVSFINKGYVSLGEIDYNDSFSIGFWMKPGKITGDPAIISNKDWASGSNIGWYFGATSSQAWWNLTASGNSRLDYKGYPISMNQWQYVVISYDRENGKVDFYKDGIKVYSQNVGNTINANINTGLNTILGRDGKEALYTSNGSGLDVELDEFMIFNKALNQYEVKEIAESYDLEVPKINEEIDSTDWEIKSCSSQETLGENGLANNMIDGNENTIWHTEWVNNSPNHPHEVVIDLYGEYRIDGIKRLARSNGRQKLKDYDLYVSNSDTDWSKAVKISGAFENELVSSNYFEEAPVGRYIKLVTKNNHDNSVFGVIAELGLYGELVGEKVVKEKNIALDIVGAEHTTKDSEFTLNVQIQTPNTNAKINKIVFDLEYDENNFEFLRSSKGTVEKLENGDLRLTVATGKSFSGVEGNNYRDGRLTKLEFKTINDINNDSNINIKNVKVFVKGEELGQDEVNLTLDNHNIRTHASLEVDYNEDGLISIGDIGKVASTLEIEKLREIAELSGFYPYKRTFILGLDGAGLGAMPADRAPYRRVPNDGVIKNTLKSSGKESIRQIPFMESMFKSGAVTYEATVAMPSNSAPGWTSMLHAYNYYDVENKYRIENAESGTYYYPEGEGKYPSIIKQARELMPNRKIAAYAEWTNIYEGIVEQSIGAEMKTAPDDALADKVVDYIKEGKAKDTSLFFLQLSDVDYAGHGYRWYEEKFYETLSREDRNLEKIVTEIKNEDLYDDSLVVIAADHGGVDYGHGNTNKGTVGTFISLNGPTINENVELKGGMIRDIPHIITNAMELEEGNGWGGTIFDGNMFIEQKDIKEIKNRDIENIKITKKDENVAISINNIKNTDINVIDTTLEYDSEATSVDTIDAVEGVNILKTYNDNGKLRVIALLEEELEENNEIINVRFTSKNTDLVSITKGMLARETGKEIFTNLEEEKVVTPEEIVVEKVSNLKAEATSDTIELTWDAPESKVGLEGYIVYKDGKAIATVPVDETSYKVGNLRRNTIYGLKVIAKYSNGEESKPQSKNIRTKK